MAFDCPNCDGGVMAQDRLGQYNCGGCDSVWESVTYSL